MPKSITIPFMSILGCLTVIAARRAITQHLDHAYQAGITVGKNS
jgi:hypothetical protein